MRKKIFFTLLLTSLFIITLCSYSLANTNAGNKLMNAGKSVENAIGDTVGAVVDGAKDLKNSASNMMNNMTNANGNHEYNDATNTLATTDGIFDMNNSNYTATRTATANNNPFGMSGTAWTWMVIGVVGAIIVALVWYYGAQYEHRNYNND